MPKKNKKNKQKHKASSINNDDTTVDDSVDLTAGEEVAESVVEEASLAVTAALNRVASSSPAAEPDAPPSPPQPITEEEGDKVEEGGKAEDAAVVQQSVDPGGLSVEEPPSSPSPVLEVSQEEDECAPQQCAEESDSPMDQCGLDDEEETQSEESSNGGQSSPAGSDADDPASDSEAGALEESRDSGVEIGEGDDPQASEEEEEPSAEEEGHSNDLYNPSVRYDAVGYDEPVQDSSTANQEEIPEDGWVMYQTVDGHDYYYNHHTGESQWASDVGNDSEYASHHDVSHGQEEHMAYAQLSSTHGRHMHQQSPPKQTHMSNSHKFYDPSSVRAPHPASIYQEAQSDRPPAVTFYRVPAQQSVAYGNQDHAADYSVGGYEEERRTWDQDSHDYRYNDNSYVQEEYDPNPNYYEYDEESGAVLNNQYSDDANDASSESDDGFNAKFAQYIQSSSGQRALEEEKMQLERKADRMAKKKLKEEARQAWMLARRKGKASDDDLETLNQKELRIDRRGDRSGKLKKRHSHWEVDDAEQGMSYFSGRDTGSTVSSGTTSTDDDDISSDDSDVETILSPTIPRHLTSANAAIETLRPVKLFVQKFVEVGYEVTKEIAGTVWSTAAGYALDALTKSIEVIQNRGGATYNMLNDALVEFVEADIERNAHTGEVESTTTKENTDTEINVVSQDIGDTSSTVVTSSSSAAGLIKQSEVPGGLPA